MLVMIAGPYSAPTQQEREANLERINLAAVRVAKKGHVPIVGANAAQPVVDLGDFDDPYHETMRISLALAEKCDAILCIGESKGVEMEKQVFEKNGLPVFYSLEEIPEA